MSAVISDCGRYRYRLERTTPRLGLESKLVVFIGVNPSTADATVDDATVRKWRGFALRWGYTHFVVGNLFAYRATDVKALATVPNPVGERNDDHLRAMLRDADTLVPCWGDRGKLPKQLHARIDRMWDLIAESGAPVHALGITKGGDPKHLPDWRADGVEVYEIENVIPWWAARFPRAWCFAQDVFNFRNPWR